MRVGQNPAKGLKEVEHVADITAAITTYIPFLSGYYRDSLEVFKRSIASLRANADLPFDLMVFDNGSCEQVREYLLAMQREGKIQYLIFSEQNMGVIGAWNVIFGAAPGKYIAYSDYDIYFYPNWLSALIEVLEIFPLAGMVTGMPLLTPVEFSSRTVKWADESPDVQLESGQAIAGEDVWRHGKSIGISREETRKFFEVTPGYRVGHKGKYVNIGAGHFQFVGRKDTSRILFHCMRRDRWVVRCVIWILRLTQPAICACAHLIGTWSIWGTHFKRNLVCPMLC